MGIFSINVKLKLYKCTTGKIFGQSSGAWQREARFKTKTYNKQFETQVQMKSKVTKRIEVSRGVSVFMYYTIT